VKPNDLADLDLTEVIAKNGFEYGNIRASLSSVFLHFPFSVVEGTYVSRLQPARDTMKVEGVITNPPGRIALFRCSGYLIGLAVDAEVHDMIAADRAVVDDNVPRP